MNLPPGYDLSKAKASYLNGFLRIDVPVAAQPKSKSGKVSVDEVPRRLRTTAAHEWKGDTQMMTSPDTEFISILGPSERDGASTRFSARSLPETLPILGLSDIVFFPSMVAPLLVEAAGSIKLIDDVVGGDRLIGVVLQRNPDADDPKPEEMHAVGCAARVLKMLKFPDNTVRVLVEGLWRIRIKEYTASSPYLRAKFELLRDQVEDSVEEIALLRNAQSLFQEIIKLSPALSEQIKTSALNTEDPGHFADLAAINLNLGLEDRQTLLETISIRERLQRLLPLMNRENQVLALSSKIQSEVATNISKTQRDFFLREQMRAIQRELGEGRSCRRRDPDTPGEDRDHPAAAKRPARWPSTKLNAWRRFSRVCPSTR